jgi:uncharacterized protein (DUF1499 family)
VQSPSKIAGWARTSALLGAGAFALGPLLIRLGLPPFLGFRLFLLGALLGLVGVVLGAIGLWQTRAAAGRAGRGAAAVGAGVGLLLVIVVLASAAPSSELPVINDITTDTNDPPTFAGRDLPYPAGFAEQQRAGYPDLGPIRLGVPPAAAFPRAVEAAQLLGWKLEVQDAAAGRIEARDVTRIFRFVDDIAVRIRADGSGSRIDVRSKSRDGRGDLGANAARIEAFREAIGG